MGGIQTDFNNSVQKAYYEDFIFYTALTFKELPAVELLFNFNIQYRL